MASIRALCQSAILLSLVLSLSSVSFAQTQYRIQGSKPSSPLSTWVKCDIASWSCAGTHNVSEATRFVASNPTHKPNVAFDTVYHLHPAGYPAMCLQVNEGTLNVALHPCEVEWNMFWSSKLHVSYLRGRHLEWNGADKQLTVTSSKRCMPWEWRCRWTLVDLNGEEPRDRLG